MLKKLGEDVPTTFNARAETVDEKPMFRERFKRRRCIVPASGFFKWNGEKEEKQPHLFTAADGSPVLAFADLWESEGQAFRLASAFLLPSTTYPHEVSRASLASLLTLKERWRVSVKAQIKRLSDLELIPAEHTTDLYKLYSAKGWNREEPLDREWAIPEPRNLADSLSAIVSGNVRTKADMLTMEFTMSAGDIEDVANLPGGWFSYNVGQIVQLKHNADRAAGRPESAAGIVLPFNRRS